MKKAGCCPSKGLVAHAIAHDLRAIVTPTMARLLRDAGCWDDRVYLEVRRIPQARGKRKEAPDGTR